MPRVTRPQYSTAAPQTDLADTNLDTNAVKYSGYNRQATIEGNEFVWLGQNAIGENAAILPARRLPPLLLVLPVVLVLLVLLLLVLLVLLLLIMLLLPQPHGDSSTATPTRGWAANR